MSRTATVLTILAAALFAVAALRLLASGEAGAPFSFPGVQAIFDIRATRLLSGLAVGGALGTAGVILQTLLRNPLASPDVVGVSAGASLGVMLNLYLSAKGMIGVALASSAVWQFIPAAAGAAAVLLILVLSAGWTIFRTGGRGGKGGSGVPTEPVTLLLTGVVISVLCGAAVNFLQALMPDAGFGTSRLLMGSLNEETTSAWAAVSAVAIAVAVTLGATLGGRTLDALSLPHDEAVSVGVNVARVRLIALVSTGLLCAAAVVIAGPIGFIGLIAPHAARVALGPAHASHRSLIAASAIAGAVLVVAADTLVRTINIGGGRLPLSILTALIGGPTLIYLLRKDAHGRA